MSFSRAAAVLLSTIIGCTAATAAETTPATISVNGTATVSAPPDLAVIDGGVTTDGKTAREASDHNNAAMGKVLLGLQNVGLSTKDYQTSLLSLQPQFTPNKAGTPQLTGYRATNRVSIRIQDITTVAQVVDALVSSGANDIGGISFMVSERSKLLDDARTKALEDAKRKAEIYATAAGVSLGAPLSITEQGTPGPVMYRRVAADAAAPAPIAPGEETLRVNVSVTWAIK